jgi:pyruvate,water dikinase
VIDVGRAAARAHGAWLERRGVLDDAEDVFYLTADELGTPPGDARERVTFRRARRAHYQSLVLPEHWVGMPEPILTDAATGDTFAGVGASPGVVEGRVRVARDLVEAEALEPGEILVCHHTDPGWASLLVVAAAFVVEVGGRLSHAAIVARELGTPCVVGVPDITRRLCDGDRIRIDGGTGAIERLSAASAETAATKAPAA